MISSKNFWNKQAKHFHKAPDTETNLLVTLSNQYLSQQAKVLDYACATGTITRSLAPLVKTIIGIDYSEEMIHYANQYPKQPPNLYYMSTTIDNNQLESQSFNVVTAFNIFHLVEDINQVLDRIHVLLTHDGLMIACTPCMGESKGFKAFFVKLISIIPFLPNVTVLTQANLEKRFESHGFKRVESTFIDSQPLSLFTVYRKEKHHDTKYISP